MMESKVLFRLCAFSVLALMSTFSFAKSDNISPSLSNNSQPSSSLNTYLHEPHNLDQDLGIRNFPCVSLLSGFYFGISVGYEAYKLKDNLSFSDEIDGIGISANPNMMANGFLGGLFIGYGKSTESFYLGFEVFGQGNSAESDYTIEQNVSALATDVTVQNNLGIFIIPGVKLNRASLLFIKLGYTWLRLDIDEVFRNGEEVSTEYDVTKTTNGFTYGIGIESAFFSDFSLRTEYIHGDYKSFTTKLGARIHGSSNQYVLSMVYHI